jgi:hypothetical protein
LHQIDYQLKCCHKSWEPDAKIELSDEVEKSEISSGTLMRRLICEEEMGIGAL